MSTPRLLLQKLRLSPLRPTHPPRPFHSTSFLRDSTADARSRARLTKVLDRIPRFLRPYTDGLRTAPLTHIVSFLVLHEITAIAPLVALAYYFHATKWLPDFVDASSISAGIQKYGAYFRRKGYFGISDETALPAVEAGAGGGGWEVSEAGARVVLEVAVAYAVTKALLPLRLGLSVWATPWFARVFVARAGGGVRSVAGRVRVWGREVWGRVGRRG